MVLALVVAIVAWPSSAAPIAPMPAVTFVAVPDLRWSDVAHTSYLAALAHEGAVANLSVRSEAAATRCGDGLLELSAGTRVPGGVGGCRVDDATFRRLAQDYRSARFEPRLGTLGDVLPSATVATDPAAAVMLATHDGPLPIGRPAYQALDVHVDAGLYGVVSPAARLAADEALGTRIAVLLRQATTNPLVVIAGVSDGPTGDAHLHPLIVVGHGWRHRLLTSPTTGRDGYVQLIDLTATLVHWAGQPIPAHVDGRVMHESDGDVPSIADLVDDDVHARAASDVSGATRNIIAVALLAVVALAIAGRREARWAAALAAPAPVMTFLVQLVPWWRWGTAAYAATVVGACVVVAIGVRGRGLLAIPIMTAAVLAVDQVLGSPLQLSAPMGDNPLVAGRFHGMGNIAFGLFAASILLIAGARRRVAYVVALGVVAVAIDGAPMLGDDFGGVLALVPSLVLLGALVAGVRVTVRRTATVAVATAIVAFGVGLLDALRPESSRTHIGRFVVELLHGHSDAVVQRKGSAMLASFGYVVLDALVVAVGAAAYAVRRRLPAAFVALTVLAVLGTLLNDSGVAVAAAVAMVAVPSGVETLVGDTRPQVSG